VDSVGYIEVIPVGLLKRYVGDRELPILVDGGNRTVDELLGELGIPSPLVAIVLVNGRQELKTHILQDGDVVKLVPLVGGG